MGLFVKILGGGGHDQPPEMPWDRTPSIYAHISSHLDEDHKLTEAGQLLPDEESINARSQIRWAAGATDGVMIHHMGGSNEDRAIKALVKNMLACIKQPTAKNKAAVYRHVMEENTVSMIDSAIEALLAKQRINYQRLFELAHSFATEAPDRGPVKFGLAILGLFQADNEELFQTIGCHDEFTLFCAVALSNSEENAERSLWKLAQNVDGWGRIHAVERLRDAQEPDVKD